jgi:small-conductance mechanosensitive channel
MDVDVLQEDVIRFGTQVAASFAIFMAFWIGSIVTKIAIRRLGRIKRLNRDVLGLLEQSARALILILGAITALATLGVNVTALVAGLGLTGFALGFAFQDLVSNLLAGVMLIMYGTVKRGDYIWVTGHEGHVAQVNLRYTVLRSESKTILIPNATLFTNTVVILTPKDPKEV